MLLLLLLACRALKGAIQLHKAAVKSEARKNKMQTVASDTLCGSRGGSEADKKVHRCMNSTTVTYAEWNDTHDAE